MSSNCPLAVGFQPSGAEVIFMRNRRGSSVTGREDVAR
jgi:hypothetical protein